jgi:phosphoglycerate dehydrogenase-like enzyme
MNSQNFLFKSMRTQKQIVVLDDWEQNFQKQSTSQADWKVVNSHADVTIHHETLRGNALVAALLHADAVVLMRDRTPFKMDLIARLPNLKYVVFTGTRNTQIDFEALAVRGIPVGCTAFGPSKENTCEITWGLILGVVKQLEANSNLMRQGEWRNRSGTQPMSILSGQRFGVIGLGEIGGRVAQVGLAFGMDVVCWSPNMTPERAAAKGVTSVSLDELLTTSKVVSLHIVPSPATKHFINAERLGMMRSDAVLINTSRASLIDMDALQAALNKAYQGNASTNSKGCGFAGIDVYDEEPMPSTHPIRKLPNVLLTPHVGFVCEPVFKNFDNGVAECLAAWVQDQTLVRTTTGN